MRFVRVPVRLPVLVPVLVPVLLPVLSLVMLLSGAWPRVPADRPGPEHHLAAALGVLRDWDARRLAAWRADDPGALAALYAPGSRAGVRDVRLLRAYDDHGLVVRQLWTQVFAVRLLRRTPSALRLSVFDRVAGGVAERAGERVPLSSTRPVTRVLDLRRENGRWLVVETRVGQR